MPTKLLTDYYAADVPRDHRLGVMTLEDGSLFVITDEMWDNPTLYSPLVQQFVTELSALIDAEEKKDVFTYDHLS